MHVAWRQWGSLALFVAAMSLVWWAWPGASSTVATVVLVAGAVVLLRNR